MVVPVMFLVTKSNLKKEVSQYNLRQNEFKIHDSGISSSQKLKHLYGNFSVICIIKVFFTFFQSVFYIKHSIWFKYLLVLMSLAMGLFMGAGLLEQHQNLNWVGIQFLKCTLFVCLSY